MLTNRSVLIVDDEEAVRRILTEYLADEGYLVYEAQDGPPAIEIVEKHRPNLVLLDLKLMTMSGIDVLKRIKEISPPTVVVMLTGSLDELHARQAIKLGAYDYVTKPIGLEDVKHLILDRVFPLRD